MVRRKRPKDVHRWLATGPSLDELADAFPKEWQIVQREVGEVLARADEDGVADYLAGLSRPRQGGVHHGVSPEATRLSNEIQRHLAVALLRQVRLSVTTGVTEGRVRFNLVNGYVAQRLLFVRDLERKPVSLHWFRVLWPLLWQKRLLMPLVERKGIYCFYSRPLIRQLAEMIGERPCLEIGAGDGTLARFLSAEGVQMTATDDYSWGTAVSYPDHVARMDAGTALRRYQPEVVICSWPPAGNLFEREVFRTRSVDLYIVIGSTSERSAGDWGAYRKQVTFTIEQAAGLSRLVLPPEVSPAVYVFRRAAGGTPVP